MPEIRIVLADDDPLSRSAIASLLTNEEDLAVVGEAADGAAAIRAVEAYEPDVLVMDVRMPEMDGVEATKELTTRATEVDPPVRILILTAFQDETTIRSLAAGASGFLLKRSHHDLVAAVRAVAAGDAWIDPAVAPSVLAALRAPAGRRHRSQIRARLTPRERQVAALMVEGLYNEEIAARLEVALPTVKTHITRVRTKTGSRNRVEAVVAVLQAGLVTL